MKKIFIILILLVGLSVESQTVESVQTLINTNLASGTSITAEEHREVENGLLSLITQMKTQLPLAKGTYSIGDVSTTDLSYTITFPDVGTNNYYVLGAFKSKSSNYNNDNDIVWVWKSPSSNSFIIGVREVAPNTQNVDFVWEIKPL
jgi:hypothetical protein